MLRFMNQIQRRRQHGLMSLFTLFLVVLLCTGQTSGLVQSCPKEGRAALSMAQDHPFTFQTSSPEVQKNLLSITEEQLSDDCDLASHLLQNAQLEQESQLSLYFAVIFVLALIPVLPLIPSAFRRNLVQVLRWRYRPHLHLCVFNE